MGCGVQKPQELLWAGRNHHYIHYFHVFSLVRCINKAWCPPEMDEWSVFQELLSDCYDFFLQNKQFWGQNVKLASLKAPPVCDHVTQRHLIH